MKLIFSIFAIAMAATTATANGPCSPGNAAFCDLAGAPGPQGPQGPAGTDGGFSGTVNAPAGIRPDAIGNGTPEQGVVRLRSEDGDTFHVVNQNTVFKRADGGTATVNAGDRISNAHEAELRNRAEIVDDVVAQIGTPADGQDGADGADGKDGKDGRDGQDFDATGHAAALASSTALAGLQFQSLSAGQTGWATGIGGQFSGDAAIAIGINHGLNDDITVNASIASTFDGNGVSAYIGASGRF